MAEPIQDQGLGRLLKEKSSRPWQEEEEGVKSFVEKEGVKSFVDKKKKKKKEKEKKRGQVFG